MTVSQPSRAGAYGLAAAASALAVAIVAFPEDAFQASLQGLKLWLEIVLPALLPFFALADILMGLGVIHCAGVLLEPLMRPVFRIPGSGAFAVAIGLASGYPLGAKVTGRLCRQGLCNPVEGERLISFANTADPLFMAGAIAVGMFARPELAGTLMAAHYLAAVGVGLLMRFHAPGAPQTPEAAPPGASAWRRALAALYRARSEDARPVGQLFGDAVREAVTSLLFVGGCIILFSVFIRVLTVSGAVGLLTGALTALLGPLGASPDLLSALLKGTVEITIGAEEASRAQLPLAARAVAASAIVAWSGLSVHAQVAAMVHGTGIRIGPYLLARLAHAFLAALWTVLLLGPLAPAQQAVARWLPATVPASPGFLTRLAQAGIWAGWIAAALLAVVLAVQATRRLAFFWYRRR